MSLKILGVITDEKIDKIKVNKYINDLSNKLFDANIQHLIIEDSVDGIGIMLIDDAPSLLVHNDVESQWEYLAKYIDDNEEEPILNQTYVIEDNNKETDILEFIKIVLKVSGGK